MYLLFLLQSQRSGIQGISNQVDGGGFCKGWDYQSQYIQMMILFLYFCTEECYLNFFQEGTSSLDKAHALFES